MIEIFILIGVLIAMSNRQKQRAVESSYVAVAGMGFGLLLLAGISIGPIALVLRWMWVGGCYWALENLSQEGQMIGETWKCPDCLQYNEPETLVCLCGYQHPEANLSGGATTENVGVEIIGAESAPEGEEADRTEEADEVES